MTNEDAKNIIIGIIEDYTFCGLYVELNYDQKTFSDVIEALNMAVASLTFTTHAVKIDITEHHTFAKPDDTSGLKFGD